MCIPFRLLFISNAKNTHTCICAIAFLTAIIQADVDEKVRAATELDNRYAAVQLGRADTTDAHDKTYQQLLIGMVD